MIHCTKWPSSIRNKTMQEQQPSAPNDTIQPTIKWRKCVRALLKKFDTPDNDRTFNDVGDDGWLLFLSVI